MEKSKQIKRHIAHFGTIAFNYSIFGASLIVLALLSAVIVYLIYLLGLVGTFIYYLFLIFSTILTIGILWLDDGYRDMWGSGGPFLDKLKNIGEFANEKVIPVVSQALPVVLYVVLALSVVAFICMMFDPKWEKAKSRLIFIGIVILLLIFLAVAIAIGIISMTGGGQ